MSLRPARRYAVTILSGLLLLLAVACGGGPDLVLTEGTVVGKSLTPSHDYWITTCVAYGKYGCTAYVPMHMHEDAKYYLEVKGLHDGDQVTETHRVSLDAYNTSQRGDYVEGLTP